MAAGGFGELCEIGNFNRLYANGEMIMGTSYKRARQTNSSVVCYKGPHNAELFLQVSSIHCLTEGNRQMTYFQGKKFERGLENFATGCPEFNANLFRTANSRFIQVQPLL